MTQQQSDRCTDAQLQSYDHESLAALANNDQLCSKCIMLYSHEVEMHLHHVERLQLSMHGGMCAAVSGRSPSSQRQYISVACI